jgi:hypothetical protein
MELRSIDGWSRAALQHTAFTSLTRKNPIKALLANRNGGEIRV